MTKKAEKSDPVMLLGQRIRELRKKKGLTQEELGEKSGISYKYLGSIERGLENPSFRHLSRLAKSLGVELDEIFKFQHLEPSRSKILKNIGFSLNGMTDAEIKLAFKLIKTLNK